MRRVREKLKSLIYLAFFYISGCSKDISKLPIEQQAIYHPERWADDIARDRYRNPVPILEFLDLSPGMKVVDLLGGGGYYTELFSYIVGDSGKVYIQNNSLFLSFSEQELIERLSANRLKNVIRLDSEYANLNLPESVDIIFVGLSLHDFYVERDDPAISANPKAFYSQAYRALKPEGLIIVIDHSAKLGSKADDATSLHRIEEGWVKQQMQVNGFEFLASLDVLRNPSDDRTNSIWDKSVIRKTDRFIHKYRKPKLDNK